MNKKTITITLSAAIVALALMINITHGLTKQVQIIETVKIVKMPVAIVGSDPQKVTIFVNELMEKRQANCLLWIFNKESRMDSTAKNPTSTAKGVGQLLDSTYKTIGLKHSADPIAQVVASIAYISRHYGSDGACAAKSFWQKHSYY